MKTVYINEPGIRPWESINPTNDARFTTTTLLDHNFNSAWDSWCDVMAPLSNKWPIKREWSATTNVDFNSKAEEYLFKKNTANTLNIGDLCKKNEKSNIYSTIKNRSSNPRKIQNLALEGSHEVILVIQETETEIEDLWCRMTIFEKRITPENISIFLESQPNMLLCRFYDSETHAAAQFIYKAHHENEIILKKIKSRFDEISIDDVHHYINGTLHNRWNT